MADEEKCPGCRQPFAEDAITGMLGDPWKSTRTGKEKRRWHLRCHQDAYNKELNRDRRTRDQRRAMGDWTD